jgi:hypothetical protein
MNNGYATIEINGEVIGLKFGLPCIAEMLGKEVPADAAGSVTYSAELLWTAYKNNCLVKKTEYAHTFQTFYDFVEDAFLDDEKQQKLTDVVNVYLDSKFIKATQEVVDDTKKKNGQQMESSNSATGS